MTFNQEQGIVTPHEHDVLSGRGNFVNYHAGNEHFRALVRKHKVAYVACPKPQKAKFSRMIVDEIKSRTPPGRFLKQDQATKLWYDIGEKKALDKTRQALREGAPEIMKEMNVDEDGGEDEEEDVGRQNSPPLEIHRDNQQVIPQLHEPVPVPVPEDMMPNNIHSVHPGHYNMPPPESHPYDNYNPAVNDVMPQPHQPPSSQQPVMLNDMGPPQQHIPVVPPTHPAPARIMRNGLMGPSSGSMRSLAGFRRGMQQQQAQRNAGMQQHMQTQRNVGMQQQMQGNSGMYMNHYHQQQNVPIAGIGGYGENMQSKLPPYPHMQPSMGDQYEPRPISNNGNPHSPYRTSPTRDVESHEYVGPLPGPLPQRYRSEKEFQREASDRSITMEKLFSNSSSDHANKYDGNNSAISIMSLSIGDIVTRITAEDAKNGSAEHSDPDQLAPLFDSSIRLGPGEKRRKGPNRSQSVDGSDLNRVMDMSVATLGGELSEIGDASIMRMTGSAADMSFTNVFEDNSERDYR